MLCRTKKPRQILVSQSDRFSGRVYAAVKKDFIGVKVADPGDQLLIEQNRFHRAAVFFKNCLKLPEPNFKRVRAKAACSQKLVDIFDQLDLAKFSLIVECQAAVIGETKNHARRFRRYLVVFEVLK